MRNTLFLYIYFILSIISINYQVTTKVSNELINREGSIKNFLFISTSNSYIVYNLSIQTEFSIFSSITGITGKELIGDISEKKRNCDLNDKCDDVIISIKEHSQTCHKTALKDIKEIFSLDNGYIDIHINGNNQYILWQIDSQKVGNSRNLFVSTYNCFILVDAFLLGIVDSLTVFTPLYGDFYVPTDIKETVYNYEPEIGYTLISLTSSTNKYFLSTYLNTKQCNEIILIDNEIPKLSPSSTSKMSVYTIKNMSIESFRTNLSDAITLGMSLHTSILKIKASNFSFILYKNNQENIENKLIPIIDLQECENILKNVYNIVYPNELYIAQIIFPSDSSSFFKYKVYDNMGNELDLLHCEKTKMENEFIHKKEEKMEKEKIINYAHYSAKNNNQKNETPTKNNYSICGEGCTFNGVNFTTMRVSCTCPFKKFHIGKGKIRLTMN